MGPLEENPTYTYDALMFSDRLEVKALAC